MKDALRTGDVAKICEVSPRTVHKWFDSGLLIGFRLPGRTGDRRITRAALAEFMRKHNMPQEMIDRCFVEEGL